MYDIGNAYLNAPNREKVYVICKKDIFSPADDVGKRAIVVRALYEKKQQGQHGAPMLHL